MTDNPRGYWTEQCLSQKSAAHKLTLEACEQATARKAEKKLTESQMTEGNSGGGGGGERLPFPSPPFFPSFLPSSTGACRLVHT